MLTRLLVPALVLAMVGCIPTGKTCNKGMATSTSCSSGVCSTESEDVCCSNAQASSCCSAGKMVNVVELKTTTLDQLSTTIASLKGKVVVVNLWGASCAACKAEFPSLVALHRKYGPDGVACLSVSVDKPEHYGEALHVLQQNQATFANYRLEEDSATWQQKWSVKTLPAVLVFDREGQLISTFTNDSDSAQSKFSYEMDIDPLVRMLLAGF